MSDLARIRVDWHQMEYNWDLKKKVFSVHFGSPSQNEQRTDLKSPWFVPFGVNLAQMKAKSDIPVRSGK